MAAAFESRWLPDLARDQSAPGTGSVLLDLSMADVEFGTVDRPYYAHSLRVDGAGAVKFTGIDGTVDTWTVAAGEIIPITVRLVWRTGTTATGIHAVIRQTTSM